MWCVLLPFISTSSSVLSLSSSICYLVSSEFWSYVKDVVSVNDVQTTVKRCLKEQGTGRRRWRRGMECVVFHGGYVVSRLGLTRQMWREWALKTRVLRFGAFGRNSASVTVKMFFLHWIYFIEKFESNRAMNRTVVQHEKAKFRKIWLVILRLF